MSDKMIKQGMSVQIRRTDGRMHPAMVSSVNEQQRCVTVEWFEKGETKGKEIDFDLIFALNSDLISNHHGVNNVTLEPQNLARESSTSWDEDEEEDEESPQEVYATDCDNGNVKNKNSMSVNSLPNPRTAATRASVPSLKTGGRQSKVYPSVNLSNTINNDKNTTRGVENIPPSAPQQVTAKHINDTVNEFRVPDIPAPREARKSKNVVKEVEKLKKNREERRQRQAEKKIETKALMNVDPGNPNWQFLNMIREFQAANEFRPLRDTDPIESYQITVCVRKRPLNKKENLRKEVDVISVTRKDLVVVHEPKHKVDLTKYLENHQFRFDYAFDETCSNETVYKFTAKPLVQTVFEGGMATCFAYGQTGSGKTHTMGGTFSGKTQDCNKGIYAMVAKDVFQYLHSPPFKHRRFVVSTSFFEIYSGKVFDLLNDKAKLRVLEDGKQQIQIVGLTEKVVDSVDNVLLMITLGNQARTSGQTSANSNSSRSHAVFQITLRLHGSQNIHGKFSLIDLAGNERGADTSSSNRLTRMEGAEINKSLLALKECIRALGRKGAHLPFRASKLTQVLRDSFISDNTKTCMIAMISPGMSSCEHTLNTLRYADRVKELAAIDPLDESLPDRSSPGGEKRDENGDDLAALRSLNEAEISSDMLNFHEAISQLQVLEDDVLDGFKLWRDSGARELELVEMVRQVDYDQDAFATLLDSVLGERAKVLESLRDKVKAFRNQLVAEEEMSKRMVHDDNPGR